MKRISLFLILFTFIITTVGKAQTTTFINYAPLENKLSKSDEAIKDEKKSSKAKTWIARAEAYMDSYEVNMKWLRIGMPLSEVKLIFGEPNEIQTVQIEGGAAQKCIYDRINMVFKDDALKSYEETKKMYDNPLPVAKEALEKATALDTDGKLSKDIKDDFDRLKRLYESQAGSQFDKEKFAESLSSFEDILAINKLKVYDNYVDTMIMYFAGMTASRAGMNDKAIDYYELARKYNYPEPNLYVFLKKNYFEKGDTATGMEVIGEGFKKYPEDQAILIELINYYLSKGLEKEALDYLSIARANDPDNISFTFAEATMYDKIGNTEKAIELYNECIEKQPNYFNGYYNLGVLYYNYAIKLYEKANSIVDNKEYEKAKKIADDELAKALPFMEKSYELASDKVAKCETLNTLKTLYYRMKINDKLENTKVELSTLGCE
ncbi:MAG: tetratricopeptide repeat protein [Bacteroidales bacterium]|nr:tetratricopeptide repeat protein [Bacteroidales bacterium]